MINRENVGEFIKKNKVQIIVGGIAALLLGGVIIAIASGSNSVAPRTTTPATETSNLSASEIETDAAGKIIAVKVGETEYELKEYESEEKDGAIVYKLADGIKVSVNGEKAIVSIEEGNEKASKVAEQATKVAETTEETQETTVEQTTEAQTTVAQATTKAVVATQATQQATAKPVEATTAQVVAPVVTPPVVDSGLVYPDPMAFYGMPGGFEYYSTLPDKTVTAISRYFTGFPTPDKSYTYTKGNEPDFPDSAGAWTYGDFYKPLQMQYTNGNGHWFNMWCFYYKAATDHTGTSMWLCKLEDDMIFEQMQNTIAQSLGYTDKYNLYQNGGGTNNVYLGNFEGVGPVGVCFMLKW